MEMLFFIGLAAAFGYWAFHHGKRLGSRGRLSNRPTSRPWTTRISPAARQRLISSP